MCVGYLHLKRNSLCLDVYVYLITSHKAIALIYIRVVSMPYTSHHNNTVPTSANTKRNLRRQLLMQI